MNTLYIFYLILPTLKAVPHPRILPRHLKKITKKSKILCLINGVISKYLQQDRKKAGNTKGLAEVGKRSDIDILRVI